MGISAHRNMGPHMNDVIVNTIAVATNTDSLYIFVSVNNIVDRQARYVNFGRIGEVGQSEQDGYTGTICVTSTEYHETADSFSDTARVYLNPIAILSIYEVLDLTLYERTHPQAMGIMAGSMFNKGYLRHVYGVGLFLRGMKFEKRIQYISYQST